MTLIIIFSIMVLEELGESFDWSMLKEVNKPVFLAGGINLSNIDEALKMNVYGLDVSVVLKQMVLKIGKKLRKS